METKICSKCLEEKPVTEFRKNRTRLDGLDGYCKPCRHDYMRLDREKNPERYRDYYNKWRSEHTEAARKNYKDWYKANKKRKLDYNRRHYQENKETINQITLRHRHKNIEQHRASKRRWYHQNPQSTINSNSKRRARIDNAGSYTQAEWSTLCASCDHRCLCCGEKKKLTPDHVIPLSKGGSNTIDNIQPLCKSCNSRKWTKIIDYR